MSVNKSGRTIQATRKVTARTILLRWETMLVFLFLAVNAMNIAISPNYLNAYNLFTNVNSFLVKGMPSRPSSMAPPPARWARPIPLAMAAPMRSLKRTRALACTPPKSSLDLPSSSRRTTLPSGQKCIDAPLRNL